MDINEFTSKFSEVFDDDDLKQMVFVGVPASSKESTDMRYKAFSSKVHQATGLINGFDYVRVSGTKDPKHLGGETKSETYTIEFDKDFFKDKFVILFDDVVTSGSTMMKMKNKIEETGAKVICMVSIGRTYSEYGGGEPKPHPFINQI